MSLNKSLYHRRCESKIAGLKVRYDRRDLGEHLEAVEVGYLTQCLMVLFEEDEIEDDLEMLSRAVEVAHRE